MKLTDEERAQIEQAVTVLMGILQKDSKTPPPPVPSPNSGGGPGPKS